MDESFGISKAKYAAESYNLLVFGFTRINMDNSDNFIPDLICFIILLYYMNDEYFDKPGKDIKISADKLSITRISGNSFQSTTFCKQWISSTSNSVSKWKFKIEKKTGFIAVGITQNDNCYDKYFVWFSVQKNIDVYAIDAWGEAIDNDKGHEFERKDYLRFGVNDEIIYTLDIPSREIRFQVNNEKENIIWSNITVGQDVKYKFAICLKTEGSKITLIDFVQE